MNTHEYEKIKVMKIRGSFMIIHVEKKIIYVYSCIFMLIRVDKKLFCSFVLKKTLRLRISAFYLTDNTPNVLQMGYN